MKVHISRIHFPVTTLGPGRRIGIWFQGCSLHCPGCISVDTWDPNFGATTVAEVLDAIRQWLPESDGITVSGGEPLDQAPALEHLLRGIQQTRRHDWDVLLYSGYSWDQIANKVTAWNGLVDVLISDPFDSRASQTLAWRGSDNQRMHLLTPLGQARFAQWVTAPRSALPKALDIFFENGEVWMAGIPTPGSLEVIQERLAEAGFQSASSQNARKHYPPNCA